MIKKGEKAPIIQKVRRERNPFKIAVAFNEVGSKKNTGGPDHLAMGGIELKRTAC